MARGGSSCAAVHSALDRSNDGHVTVTELEKMVKVIHGASDKKVEKAFKQVGCSADP